MRNFWKFEQNLRNGIEHVKLRFDLLNIQEIIFWNVGMYAHFDFHSLPSGVDRSEKHRSGSEAIAYASLASGKPCVTLRNPRASPRLFATPGRSTTPERHSHPGEGERRGRRRERVGGCDSACMYRQSCKGQVSVVSTPIGPRHHCLFHSSSDFETCFEVSNMYLFGSARFKIKT